MVTPDFFLVWGQSLFSFFKFLYFWHDRVSRTFGAKRDEVLIDLSLHHLWLLQFAIINRCWTKKKEDFLVNNLRSSCISSVLHYASFQGWYAQQDSLFFLWLHWGEKKKQKWTWCDWVIIVYLNISPGRSYLLGAKMSAHNFFLGLHMPYSVDSVQVILR